MPLMKPRWGWGMLLCTLATLSTVGCAGPRLGSRLFPQETATAVPAGPHYVSGQMPLPSEQAVRPASVGMPAAGGYDAQTVQDVRTRRTGGVFGGSPNRGNCFS
jgi:hypothetical protein